MSRNKKKKEVIVERVFVGTEKLLDVLKPLAQYQIDKLRDSTYDIDKASATLEGVANK